MNILVIDAQGGGMGRMLVEELRRALPDQPITAVGTNALATSAMLKGGADQAATGENAIRVCAAKADLILAPIGMVLADAMLGEVTAEMAVAIGRSPARKIFLPVNRCKVTIAGAAKIPMAEAVESAVTEAVRVVKNALWI